MLQMCRKMQKKQIPVALFCQIIWSNLRITTKFLPAFGGIWICIQWHSNFPTCRNASCFSTAAPSVANHALSRAWGKSRKWPCFKSIDKQIPHYSKSLSFLVDPYAWQMTRQNGCAGIKRWRVGNRCGSKNIATLTRCHLAITLQMEFHRRLVHRTSPDWLKRETLAWREQRLRRRFHKMVNTEFLNFHPVSSFRFILCACFAGRKVLHVVLHPIVQFHSQVMQPSRCLCKAQIVERFITMWKTQWECYQYCSTCSTSSTLETCFATFPDLCINLYTSLALHIKHPKIFRRLPVESLHLAVSTWHFQLTPELDRRQRL